MSGKRSPLAPEAFPDLPALAGVRLSAMACGLRYQGRTDACLVELAKGTSVAGVFTRSKTASAPVEWCRRALSGGSARAILVNSGNANAFTGAAGIAAVERTAKALAGIIGCPRREVFLSSTGVIGEPLPDERLTGALGELERRLSATAWRDAAEAIMTTDTFPKGATRRVEIGGTAVTLNGIAKGSGMIAPDMATMLAFVFTDARIPADILQRLLVRAAEDSFNAITVDGDTSTSDTLLLCATGAARHPRVVAPDDSLLKGFRAALGELMADLAQQVARDGEGAEKFITIRVSGAASKRAARRIGLSIGNSPLVKTAIAGEDANWGRIVMAVGKAGEKADRDRLSIRIGGIEVAHDGAVVPGYEEALVARHMKGREIEIEVDIGVGRGRATVWTCDLTHGYIDINADYRT
ncbi:MAG: bifunctional glutamate N-acetyltransferase/amino-acid acetyltransferase ArgJ [Rhodospirillales bacterium]|nr:bifunctional glutamate N-acetyltransferase/amino-acid acetyltransferase ArgJ [Rhodospirillales bacterium]MDH3792501.1 bifunctional glutamate N-acetyltransferase/amino-acid acetyltransferase ArgJ [Rhodospirillales bacterium]MDH3912654.1 bifunctional glutamate N-acetyltransferase/amino-acid acetyltransferase ArgJ [Rhodospirillales bacterium]MDH3916694.1 bifunctional glutamate N-acetyltransferase/amino-acid acetyltransferase ArgJ [Rhodospirillales bacterium]MDH3965615.1 bifunctional glutamate N